MSKLYLIGGYTESNEKSLDLCCTYDINSNAQNKLASLNVARDCAACTVFESKIVVTGGDNNWSTLKSAEASDYRDNKLTYLADMIKERWYHAAVSICLLLVETTQQAVKYLIFFPENSQTYIQKYVLIQMIDTLMHLALATILWYFKIFQKL